ncbi:MAG: hypothetical protein OXR62_07595 [Ahrensia sp.]|nr:hypothetical protein [Ahrensia sp.]
MNALPAPRPVFDLDISECRDLVGCLIDAVETADDQVLLDMRPAISTVLHLINDDFKRIHSSTPGFQSAHC